MSTENLSVAIASLQEAQKVLEEEHKHIEEHNIDVEAHPDIRELIDKIFDGEAVYSNSQIRAIIHDLRQLTLVGMSIILLSKIV